MRNFLFSVIAALALSVIVVAQSSSTETSVGKVKGKVTDSASGQIPKVTILFECKNLNFKRQIVSDEDENFATELPAGEYRVSAEKEGYRPPKPQDIRLKSNATMMLNIKFPPIYTSDDPNPNPE